MKETIIIEVTIAGETKVSVECGQGSSCMQLTANIEKALGKKIADDPKPELYQEVTHNVSNLA